MIGTRLNTIAKTSTVLMSFFFNIIFFPLKTFLILREAHIKGAQVGKNA